MHGTYELIDNRPALRFERRLAHPIDAVWRTVTEPDELRHWFPATVTVDLRPGGAMTFDFGEGTTLDGEVLELDPPRRFVFTWGTEELRFALEPEDDGAACRLRFVHILDEENTAARNAAGWHVCLDGLAAYLDGGSAPTGGPTPEWQALYEEYQRRGLPAGAPIPGA